MANSLARFSPFRDIARFDPFRFDIDDFFSDFASLPRMRGVAAPEIRIDVSETDKHYLIKADIPGVKKDDIKVTVEGNQVSLSAEVKEEKEASGENSVYRERSYGQQSRSFTLPQEVVEKDANAKYENGVLHLTLPKKAGSGARHIAIQ